MIDFYLKIHVSYILKINFIFRIQNDIEIHSEIFFPTYFDEFFIYWQVKWNTSSTASKCFWVYVTLCECSIRRWFVLEGSNKVVEQLKMKENI